MKSQLKMALFATGVVLLAVNQTTAQQQQGGVVAVIDVKKVFDDSDAFQRNIETIKQEIKAYDEKFRKEGEALIQEQRDLGSKYKSTSPEYKAAEAELARKISDLKVRQQLKQKEIMEREAALYYDTYKKVLTLVSNFAETNGITLVLRYDSSPIDRDDRAQVIQGVNRRIVFQRNRDLTGIITEQMKR